MKNTSNDFQIFSNRLNVNFTENQIKNIGELSPKYQRIQRIALEELDKGAFELKQVRSWKMHDDMGVPIQLKRLVQFDSFFFDNVKRFLYFKLPSKCISQYFLKQSLLDDFNVIKASGYLEFLKENELNSKSLARDIYIKNGFSFNARLLRYIYILGQIKKFQLLTPENRQLHIDIGGFYGGLQSILSKYFLNSVFINVELEHQLFRSFLYQKNINSEINQIIGEKEFLDFIRKKPRLSNKPTFIYLLPKSYDLIGQEVEIDLITNFQSFGEMSSENFDYYYHCNTTSQAKFIYSTNRFVSKPSLDETYDSDLTLLGYILPNFKISYLNRFPMHNYQISKSIFLGNKGYRNASSGSFELIMEKQT